jgi:hypothetical protein
MLKMWYMVTYVLIGLFLPWWVQKEVEGKYVLTVAWLPLIRTIDELS